MGWNLTSSGARFCTWDKKKLERSGWRTALQTGVWGCWPAGLPHYPAVCSGSQKAKPHPVQGYPKQGYLTQGYPTQHHQQAEEVTVPVFSALVSPHLEQDEQFWASQHKNNVKVLECVQIRSTKPVTGLEGMSYVELLRTLACLVWGKGSCRATSLQPTAFWGEDTGSEVLRGGNSSKLQRKAPTGLQETFFLSRWWLNTAIGFLERQSMLQACQCLKHWVFLVGAIWLTFELCMYIYVFIYTYVHIYI